jgi:plasmid maintenance system antidote protein VapI
VSFKENLKEELSCSGMMVKELATKTGIKRQTIDNYLNSRSCIPPADTAVRIARVLGVSVEYLVTGKDLKKTVKNMEYSPTTRSIAQIVEHFDEKTRQTALSIIKCLENHVENITR